MTISDNQDLPCNNNNNLSFNKKHTSIACFRGVSDPERLMEDDLIKETVLKILSGDYASSDVKKLRNHDIYRIKINKKKRLLFKTVSIAQERYLLLLEFLENHEYHKSKFLKPSVLKAFCAKEQSLEKVKLIWDNVSHKEQKELKGCWHPSGNIFFNHSLLDYYNKQIIKLDPVQISVIDAPTPLIVNGAPGSGKSCTALSSITKYLSVESNQSNKKIVYICSSKNLSTAMERYWNESPSSVISNTSTVEFISFAELIKSLYPQLKDFQFVTPKETSEWFTNQCKKSCIKNLFSKEDEKIVFEEFKILSAYDKNTYLNLGKKQCLFKQVEIKGVIWDLYEKYILWLEDSLRIDTRFFTFPDYEVKFDLCLVDEAADLSPLAIAQLYNSTNDGNIVCFVDTHQDLKGSISKRPHFYNVLGRLHHGKVSSITLPQIYRCPRKVIQLANKWLGIKAYITGGISDKDEYREIQFDDHKVDNEGNVIWTEEDFQEVYSRFRTTYNEAEIAIIAEESKIANLSDNAQDYLLTFTPKTIKGLEFPCVIVLDPFANEHYRQINKRLKKCTVNDLQGNRNRSKHTIDQQTSLLIPKLNEFFTSITRTQKTLIICQKKNNSVSHILPFLTDNSEKKAAIINVSNKQLKSASEAEWLSLAQKLLDNNNIDKFNEICISKLNKTPQMVKELLINNRISCSKSNTVADRESNNDDKPHIKKTKNRRQNKKKRTKRNKIKVKKEPSIKQKKENSTKDEVTQIIHREFYENLKNVQLEGPYSIKYLRDEYTDVSLGEKPYSDIPMINDMNPQKPLNMGDGCFMTAPRCTFNHCNSDIKVKTTSSGFKFEISDSLLKKQLD